MYRDKLGCRYGPVRRTYYKPRFPVPPCTAWYARRHLVFLRGRARCRLSFRAGTRARHHLVFSRGDEAAPHLPVGRRGVASSSGLGTRRRLVFLCGDEATPRSPTRRRGVVLSYSSGTRRPSLPALGRGSTSFYRLVPPARRGYG
ncbi:hypothetical protein GW17_00027527 [Ensete ventricosum]|nr:hypothetical protein GW17_00027527 [Ensete ventricosum]